MLNLFARKRMSPEESLATFVDDLKRAVGVRLKSVIVFGSLASDEFREGHSDINVLIVIERADFDALALLAPAMRPWRRRRHSAPIISTAKELMEMSRSYPVEFLDMIDHHRVCYGDDPLSGLTVDRQALRYQCAHDLNLILLRLRQAAAWQPAQRTVLRAMLIDSLPSTLALFRAVMRLDPSVPALDKMAAAEKLATLAGFDWNVFKKITEMHLLRASDDVRKIWNDYFLILQKVIGYLHS